MSGDDFGILVENFLVARWIERSHDGAFERLAVSVRRQHVLGHLLLSYGWQNQAAITRTCAPLTSQ